VTADLEAGYGDTADDVGRTVAQAMELGAVGANLEDAVNGRLFGTDEAVDRIAAARAAAPSGTFVLNARTDTYFARTRGTSSPRQSTGRCATSKLGPTASSCQASPNRTRFAGSLPPSPARSTWWQGWRTRSTRPRSSRWAQSGSAWGAAWPGPRSACWSAPAESCTTPERSASSTARSATPTCSDASARDQSQTCRACALPRAGSPRRGLFAQTGRHPECGKSGRLPELTVAHIYADSSAYAEGGTFDRCARSRRLPRQSRRALGADEVILLASCFSRRLGNDDAADRSLSRVT
jgi:hypothetical protein